MAVSPITGDVTAFTLQSLHTVVSSGRSPLGTPASKTALSRQSETVTNANSTVSPANKQAPDAGNENQKESVRAMSHVVESYNQQGEVRIKFMDSKNNVIYQIPTEMVAKMEDQMMKPETAANVKG
ncbi:MAG: hypothetical protein HIU83_12945 [Proteobacteria bacterium]|nr:hypothetical protein [Pseudomonadota bacterium]